MSKGLDFSKLMKHHGLHEEESSRASLDGDTRRKSLEGETRKSLDASGGARRAKAPAKAKSHNRRHDW